RKERPTSHPLSVFRFSIFEFLSSGDWLLLQFVQPLFGGVRQRRGRELVADLLIELDGLSRIFLAKLVRQGYLGSRFRNRKGGVLNDLAKKFLGIAPLAGALVELCHLKLGQAGDFAIVRGGQLFERPARRLRLTELDLAQRRIVASDGGRAGTGIFLNQVAELLQGRLILDGVGSERDLVRLGRWLGRLPGARVETAA